MRQLRFPVLWFLVFTYALTFVGQGINLYVVRRLSVGMAWKPYGFYLTNVGPSLVGLLMTVYLYGLPGLRRIAARLTPWSVGAGWPVLAVCLFLPLLGPILLFTVLTVLGVTHPPASWQLSTYLYSAIISGGFLGAGMCEELGWRGFALPHLQRRYSALVSSLIIGVAWALWHWPNYFVANLYPHPLWAFAAAIPIGIFAAIIYTWVYNSTGGSLFAVVVLHGTTVSTPSTPYASSTAAGITVLSLYLIIAIAVVWRYGVANLSWRDRVVTGAWSPSGDAMPASAGSQPVGESPTGEA